MVDQKCQLLTTVEITQDDFEFLRPTSDDSLEFRQSVRYDEEDLPLGRVILLFDGLVRQMLVANIVKKDFENPDRVAIRNHWNIVIQYEQLSEKQIVINEIKPILQSAKHTQAEKITAANCAKTAQNLEVETVEDLNVLTSNCGCAEGLKDGSLFFIFI